MQTLKGISASPGIIIGKVFLYRDDTPLIPKYDITKGAIKEELSRFHDAVNKALEELEELQARFSIKKGLNPEEQILQSHILMLKDPQFFEEIKKNLEENLINIEWILFQVSRTIIGKLDNSEDKYLKERTIDIHDVSKRVLNHLLYRDRLSLSDISEEVVLVTHNLLPSDALVMNKRMIKGIAMDAGGKTSHTAILARSFEIPAVVGLSNISRLVKTGDEIIIDGNAGKVILNPDDSTKVEYLATWKEWQRREVSLLTLNELPAETRDGKLIQLQANIEVPEETDSALSHGADGIGLYRSEFLFLLPGGISSEDVQFQAYSSVLKSMNGKPVTIRTLDLGGDKTLPEIEDQKEKNPILGWRAIRFCLSRKDIFLQQLRALLRASVYGDLRIMFPMISGVEELEKVMALFEEAKRDCRKRGISFDENIPVGIMIEIPSAAMTADILARKVQFFSIGTNDLIQYTIAVDRGNEKIAYLYEPFHPGVLRLLKQVIDNAHAAGIPVGMCGEMAGDPLATIILLGLGLDNFSMSSFGIPQVKQIIRSVSLSEAEEVTDTVMEMSSFEEIDSFIKGWVHERFDFFSSPK